MREIAHANELLRTATARRNALTRIVTNLKQQVLHEVCACGLCVCMRACVCACVHACVRPVRAWVHVACVCACVCECMHVSVSVCVDGCV